MKRALFVLAFMLCAIPAFASRTYYIDFVGGADASPGTTTGSAWKHAPGMQSCSSVCAATTPTGDDFYCMKKGVTWDHTALQWNWTWKGTSGHPIYIGDCTAWGSGTYWTTDGELGALTSGYNILSIPDSSHSTPWYVDIHGWEGKRLQATDRDNDAILNIGCARNVTITASYLHDWDYIYANDRNGAASGTTPRDGAHGGIHGDYYTSSDATCVGTGSYTWDTIISNAEAAARGRQNGVAVVQFDVFGSAPIAGVWTSQIHDVATAQLYGQLRNTEIYNSTYPQTGCSVVGSNQGFSLCDSVGGNGHDPYHDNPTYFQAGDGHTGTGYRIYGNHLYNIGNSVGALFPNGCGEFWFYNNIVERTFTKGALWFDPYNVSGTTSNCGTLHMWNNTFETESGQNLVRMVSRGITMAFFDMQNGHLIMNNADSYYCDCNSTYNSATANYATASIIQTRSAATSAGYTTANLFSPTGGTSATVGTGGDLAGSVDTDVYGNARAVPYDVGAYEWQGTTYHVKKTGNDSNAGTDASPFLTIRKCAGGTSSVAVAGDTCEIHTGTYNEAIGCDYGATHCYQGTSFTNAITIKAHSLDVVTVTCTSCVDVMGWGVGASYPSHKDFYWIVQDLILDAGHDKDYGIAGLFADHIRLVNVEVKNSNRQGALPEGNSWQVLNCSFHDNGTDGQDHGFYWSGQGLILDGGSYYNNQGLGIHIFSNGANDVDNNIVRNARIYNNGLSPGGGGIILATGAGNLAYNNLIYSNNPSGLTIDYRCGLFGAPCGAYGNTIYGNVGYCINVSPNDSGLTTGAILKNNICYNNGAGGINDNGTSTVASNNTTSNPSFTNAGAANFTLTSGSTARAANGFSGANLTSLCTGVNVALCSDFAGVARGTSPDGGGYQFGPGTPISISTITPATGAQGSSVAINVTGASTNFVNGVTVCTISGTGVTVTSTITSSATTGVCNVTIDANATTGTRTITMTTGGEVAAGTNAFTVALLNTRQIQMFRIH